MKKSKILDQHDIRHKITRMACQIAEENYQESGIVFLGIAPAGYVLANLLCHEVKQILSCKTTVLKIELDKKKPAENPVLLDASFQPGSSVVILVDDVANTGKTMYYALKPLLNHTIKKLQIAVLVDRQHKQFPIAPDYVGLSLSTTLREHISVELENDSQAVYLT